MTIEEKIRRATAFMLLLLPLAAYPAVFSGVAAPRYFSDIRCITPEVFGVFALAAVVAFPGRIAGLSGQTAWPPSPPSPPR
ncbi:MAG: hypothetical protein MJ016_04445 [Victivallaceae bacterium]|nr:hypothetical protein [Victivallaceae bacterium]